MSVRIERRGGEVLARLRGDLDVLTADEVRTVLDHYIDLGCRHVILDVQHVSFLDSAGIGVILGRLRRLHSRGGRMTVVRASPHVRRLLEFSGLGGLMTFAGEGGRARGRT